MFVSKKVTSGKSEATIDQLNKQRRTKQVNTAVMWEKVRGERDELNALAPGKTMSYYSEVYIPTPTLTGTTDVNVTENKEEIKERFP